MPTKTLPHAELVEARTTVMQPMLFANPLPRARERVHRFNRSDAGGPYFQLAEPLGLVENWPW